MALKMSSDQIRAFLADRRTATLATVAPSGQPRLVPVCFVLDRDRATDQPTWLYSPLDEKPKRSSDVRDLARVRDIRARPGVTLLFERWSEDWSRLAWLRARGTATLLEPADDAETHAAVVASLRAKYPQYREQRIETLPMIRVAIDETVSWSAAPETGAG
jgi:coenzyme F420-0:L-glutamate ligase/coenzyme F420-1:gamma-L-glutamate ligase